MFTTRNSIIALMLLCAVIGFNTEAFEKDVKAIKTDTVPVMDGRLDDPCWKKAVPVKNFTISNTDKLSELGTTAYVLYDNNNLYIGVLCPEKDISSIKTIPGIERDSGNVYRGDHVEIMIDPENGKNDYYHIGISADGIVADRACTQGGFVGDNKWDGEIRAASYIGDKYWSCELVLPFYTLGINPKVGSKWAINICRDKVSQRELSSIAQEGALNVAENFPELSGMNADFSSYFFNIATPKITTGPNSKGTLNIDFAAGITNNTGKDREIIFECDLISPSQKISVHKKTDTVKNGETKNLSLNQIESSEQGDYKCILRVSDPVTKKTYHYVKQIFPVSYTPITVNMLEPWYRDAIFETQKIKDVVFTVGIQDDSGSAVLTAAISKAGEKTAILSKEIKNAKKVSRFEFPVSELPYGKLEIFTALKDKSGKVLAEIRYPLRKLPFKKGEVWLGKDMRWYIEGKAFFLQGAWNNPDDFVSDYAVFTSERPDSKYIPISLAILIKHKCGRLRHEHLAEEERKILTDCIRELRDKPELFAYMTSDEPEVKGVNANALGEVYKMIAEEDPYHPVIINNDTVQGVRNYALCADINGIHPYPIILKDKQHNDMSKVITFVESMKEIFEKRTHKQTIAYLHQGFNYGDWARNNNRIPNYQEIRNQNLLALICGATGIIQYNRTFEHYPELYIGIPAFTKELKYIGDIILAPDSKFSVNSSSKTAKSMVKELNGSQYVFVCNAQMEPSDIEISIPGIGRQSLNVISEGRSVKLSKDAFKDHFGPFEVHIYTTGDTPKLQTVKDICGEIDKANAARRKPGNLAFQMLENDGVKITVSSSGNPQASRLPSCGLWHVVDGVINTKDKRLGWYDNTPGEFPDWIEVQLPKAENINRVVVYPFNKSLKDYSVQAFVDGAWKDIDKVKNKNDDAIENKFSAIKTDRIRLWITAANGKNSEICEIEIYGPTGK
ncbi:MAG: hypothetical protein A2017_07280 [Lentisphaerae bacterium GWF2_44_16]|nr:MAG: hypothetical protein A2017_07280 [Lentisphaerae bacterium GWF2_44_16]